MTRLHIYTQWMSLGVCAKLAQKHTTLEFINEIKWAQVPKPPAPTSSNIAFNKLVTIARFLHNQASRSAQDEQTWRGRSTNTAIRPWTKNSNPLRTPLNAAHKHGTEKQHPTQ